METVVINASQVTPRWLTDVLRAGRVLAQEQVVSVELAPGKDTAMWRLVHLSVAYSAPSPAAPKALLLKLPRHYPGQNPAFHVLGRAHETHFYTQLVSAPAMASVPTVRCFDAAHDARALAAPEAPEAHVLVEDLSHSHWQTEQPLPPPDALCGEAVECVGALHAAWWESTRVAPGGDVVEYLAARLETARAHGLGSVRGAAASPIPHFLDFLADRLPPARRRVYERVLSFEPELAERQARAPQTLLHGDPHWWNFLYPRDAARDTTRILDWGSWRVGAATNDLAYMLALQWFPERRARLERPLLDRYCARLHEGGIADYDREALWRDYRLSVVWSLTKVARCWAEGWPTEIWWGHLERAMLAFEDLGCDELIRT